jgi:hypothetical protein
MVENVLLTKILVGSPGVSNNCVSNNDGTFSGNKTVSFKGVSQ